MTALEEYTRPDIAPEPMPRDGLLADAAKNLAVAASWAERYPEVEFDFYFSPYSILYWDKIGRMGETDAVFAALELACETLLPYENVTPVSYTHLDVYKRQAQAMSHVRVRGLMTIPPADSDRDTNIRYFQEVRALYVDINEKLFHNELKCLSMGMSGDFEDAIRNGATMVRVGTAIFGARYYPT